MNAHLKIKDLQQLLAAGAPIAVEFGARIEDQESYPEPGMRAYATGYSPVESDVCRIQFDFGAFDEHNKALEKPNYYDKNGEATLTAREAGEYEPQGVVYFTPTDEMSPWFSLLPTASLALFTEYLKAKESGMALPYVGWLEAQVLVLRSSTIGQPGHLG